MFQEQILVRFDQSFTASTVRESHMAGNFSACYGKPWSFKAVMSKQLKVGSQTRCLRKASWVIIQVLSDITHWNLLFLSNTGIQGWPEHSWRVSEPDSNETCKLCGHILFQRCSELHCRYKWQIEQARRQICVYLSSLCFLLRFHGGYH